MDDLLGIRKPAASDIKLSLPRAGATSTNLGIPRADPLKNLNLDFKVEAARLDTGPIAPSALQTLMQSLSNGIREHKQQQQIAKMQKRDQEIASLLEEIKEEMRRANWKKALSKLDRLQSIETLWEPVFLRAICLAGLGNYNEALAFAADGSKLCPEPDLRRAFEALENQIRATVANLPLLQAQAAMQRGDLQVALTGFDLFLRQQPRRPDVLYMKAICHIYLGDVGGAKRTCVQALACSPAPELASAIKGLMPVLEMAEIMAAAERAMGQGDFRRALQTLEDPRCERDMMAILLKVVCFIQLGEMQHAEGILHQIEQHDKSASTRQILAMLRQQIAQAGSNALIEQAMKALEAQNWGQAVRLFEQVQTMIGTAAESDPMLQFYLAAAQLRNGNIAGARVAMDRSWRNSTDKNLNKQLDQMKSVIEREEEQAPMRRAFSAMEARNWDEALGELRSILRLNPKDGNAYFHQALCHFQAGSAQMERPNANRAVVAEHFREGAASLSLAEKNCGWRDSQLKGAIANLKKQVGL
jgi:outer membrane protein assembly factor BamD (BamD/ComL family)